MKRTNHIPYIILAAALPVMLAILLISLMYGGTEMAFATIQTAFLQFNAANIDHQIIMNARLPRAAGAVFIGAALAVSGALMQGMTRNHLASPGIMGISDGSVLAVTLSMVFLPQASPAERIFFSFGGSAVGAGLVFSLAAFLPHGLSPVRLAILGTAIGTFLSSVAAALAIYFQIPQNISFWYHTRLHQLQGEQVLMIIPFILVGLLLANWLAKAVTVLSLGEEVAVSLGQRIKVVKLAVAAAVMLLTGSAVAMAGKIAFVGLIIPHITRYLVGADYKWVIPCSGVLGALFLALADILSRYLNAPFETPVGVITSLVGVPFFLYLARRKGGDKIG
jgi:iron complex transport system permease protein